MEKNPPMMDMKMISQLVNAASLVSLVHNASSTDTLWPVADAKKLATSSLGQLSGMQSPQNIRVELRF